MDILSKYRKILTNGLAYEANGSIYFDVKTYAERFEYGILSGRKLDELQAASRVNLEGLEEKRFHADFALWKKAQPEHITQWNSPWGKGFPGWHIECTSMSKKYLGESFVEARSSTLYHSLYLCMHTYSHR